MAWQGRATWSSNTLGPQVRLGLWTVPAEATLHAVGEDGQPDIDMVFNVVNGRPECTLVTFRSKEDGRGIATSDLAGLDVSGITVNAFAQFAQKLPDGGLMKLLPPSDITERDKWAILGELTEARTARRGQVTPAELKRVTEIYLANPQAPTEAVADSLGLSRRTAARRVKQAEQAGLLPETTPGKRRGS